MAMPKADTGSPKVGTCRKSESTVSTSLPNTDQVKSTTSCLPDILDGYGDILDDYAEPESSRASQVDHQDDHEMVITDAFGKQNNFTLQQARQLTVSTLEGLTPMAGRVCCVLAQPELTSKPLEKIGFKCLLTLDCLDNQDAKDTIRRAQENISSAQAIIVPTFGMNAREVTRVIEKLNRIRGVPAVVVVFIVPLQNQGDLPESDVWQASMDIALTLEKCRIELFSAGADDSICLFMQEPLRPHRLLEIIQKTDFMANKMSEILQSELNAAEKKAAAKLQAAHKNFLMSLPGRVLENIPYKDGSIEEHQEGGHLVGVADYELVTLLGSGSFGNVYKAEHPKHGICAVKFIPKKRSMKNTNEVFSLDRELGILLNLVSHKNVVRAREVLHTHHNIYVIMDFAGTLNLHKFTKATLDKTGDVVLPRSITDTFTRQQGAALWHLHSNHICHRDLKGDNWIVDDAGETLRLVDFGLAVQLCGTSQCLRQCCGSLPFCAPEVWNSDDQGTAPSYLGYNALASDIWSLGVGYMDLLLGYYSIERILDWCPKHPSDQQEVLRGLESLEEHWRSASANMEKTGLINAISNMIIVRPQDRWAMGRVVGSQGLALAEEVKPPRSTAGAARGKLRSHRRCETDPAQPGTEA